MDERNTTAAADWEAATDGDVVFMQVGYQHLLDATILKVVLDGIEFAEDDTFHPFEIHLQHQCVEQAVDAVQRLFDLFEKQDDVLLGLDMESRSGDGSVA